MHLSKQGPCSGQTLVEAILLLPLVLFFVFAVLQFCQLGVGLLVVNYGASSAARKAVKTFDVQSAVNNGDYQKLMVGGLKDPSIVACKKSSADGRPTNDVTVVAQAKVEAFPVVGPMLVQFGFQTTPVNADACQAERLPPIAFSGSPDYKFTLYGMAVARRNYLQ